MLLKTEKSKAVVDFLSQNLLVNLNMLGIMENVPEAEIYVDDLVQPKGVFIKKGYFHYIYTEEDAFLDEVLDTFFREGFFGFSGVDDRLAEKIKSRFDVTWENPCVLYYMPEENLNTELIKNPVRAVDIKDAETVDSFYTYRSPGSLKAIKEDIMERPSSAVYVNGEIACWVLVHEDNSMGIMYTKDEHRRKGYAVDVTIDLAAKIIDGGRIPFLQIVEGNQMSPGLAKKCGFELCGQVSWFGFMAGVPKEIIEANNQSKDKLLNILPKEIKEKLFPDKVEYNGMHAVLYSFKTDIGNAVNLTMKKVENEEQRQTWCDIVCSIFEFDSSPREALEKFLSGIRLDNTSEFAPFLGCLDEKPVCAAATLALGDDVSGVYFLATLPDHRKQGIASAMILEIIKMLREERRELVVLQSPKEYVHLFGELGFKKSHIKK
ncbi:MAG: GNAT family N-acetyltransferase [Bacillota bacterium]